jgi:hypothetical protein
MDLFDEDLLSLWRAFEKWNVRYILVGGFATNLHGYLRSTGDVDIWIDKQLANRKLLRKAFAETGFGDMEELETMQLVAGWSTISFGAGFTLDFMEDLKGMEEEGFAECFEMAEQLTIEGIQIRFLHYNHLIKSKQASNRLKDQLDIEELKKIKEGKEK